MHTTELASSPQCPHCGHLLDAVSSQEEAQPNEGDFSICINCAELLCFVKQNEQLTLRTSTQEDIDKLSPDEVIMLHKMQIAARHVKAEVERKKNMKLIYSKVEPDGTV